MKNLKTVAYSSIGLSLLAFNNTYAQIDANSNSNVTGLSQGTPLVDTIRSWLVTILTLLGFVAVVYGLWGGFNILTAAGDEEKVKKGKTIITNALIGIVVIFVVGMLVNWLIGLLANNSTVN